MGDNIYISFWRSRISELISRFKAGEFPFSINVVGLEKFGDRESYYANFRIVNGVLEVPKNANAHGRDLYQVLVNTEYFASHLFNKTINVKITTDLQPKIEMEQKEVAFFDANDLLFFTQLHQTDASYRKDNPQSVEKAKRVKEGIFEKTNHWASLIAPHLPDFDYEEDNGWNVSGHFKKYSWARFFLKGQREKKFFVTLGVSSAETALVYKFDCQREGANKLDDATIKRFDNFSSQFGRNWQEISANEITSHNWSSITQLVVDFVNQHLQAFKELHGITTEATQSLTNMTLNTILFGPPGTGKTFNTVNHAVSILENRAVEDVASEDRVQVKAKFDRYQQEGRIVFTTFHQSMSYEDFVEGIKPEMIEEQISYEVKPGIFKMICIEASFAIAQRMQSALAKKTLAFSSLYDQFVDSIEKTLSEPTAKVEVPTKSGGYIEIEGISPQGNILVRHKNGSRTYTISKERLTVLDQNLGDLDQISNVNNAFRDVIGGSNSSAYYAILKVIRSLKSPTESTKDDRLYSFTDKVAAVKVLSARDYEKPANPYVLIIDEINRGNIAQIFGELITLIEEDKRLGKTEALEATLPYSKDKFGMPPNLYIIGTMNTADRSVEALDTALRRRFSFKEMLPNSSLIKTQGNLKERDGKLEGIDLAELLTTINTRIEKLLDKDHLIGHSYFMNVVDLQELKRVFQNKINPLLQEYFYGDFGKIGLVIGTSFFQEDSLKTESENQFFADFPEYEISDLIQRNVYRLKDVTKMSDDFFKMAISKLLRK